MASTRKRSKIRYVTTKSGNVRHRRPNNDGMEKLTRRVARSMKKEMNKMQSILEAYVETKVSTETDDDETDAPCAPLAELEQIARRVKCLFKDIDRQNNNSENQESIKGKASYILRYVRDILKIFRRQQEAAWRDGYEDSEWGVVTAIPAEMPTELLQHVSELTALIKDEYPEKFQVVQGAEYLLRMVQNLSEAYRQQQQEPGNPSNDGVNSTIMEIFKTAAQAVWFFFSLNTFRGIEHICVIARGLSEPLQRIMIRIFFQRVWAVIKRFSRRARQILGPFFSRVAELLKRFFQEVGRVLRNIFSYVGYALRTAYTAARNAAILACIRMSATLRALSDKVARTLQWLGSRLYIMC